MKKKLTFLMICMMILSTCLVTGLTDEDGFPIPSDDYVQEVSLDEQDTPVQIKIYEDTFWNRLKFAGFLQAFQFSTSSAGNVGSELERGTILSQVSSSAGLLFYVNCKEAGTHNNVNIAYQFDGSSDYYLGGNMKYFGSCNAGQSFFTGIDGLVFPNFPDSECGKIVTVYARHQRELSNGQWVVDTFGGDDKIIGGLGGYEPLTNIKVKCPNVVDPCLSKMGQTVEGYPNKVCHNGDLWFYKYTGTSYDGALSKDGCGTGYSLITSCNSYGCDTSTNPDTCKTSTPIGEKKKNGETCGGQDDVCQSGICVGLFCAPELGDVGTPCAYDDDCKSGDCFASQCKKVTQPTTTTTQIISTTTFVPPTNEQVDCTEDTMCNDGINVRFPCVNGKWTTMNQCPDEEYDCDTTSDCTSKYGFEYECNEFYECVNIGESPKGCQSNVDCALSENCEDNLCQPDSKIKSCTMDSQCSEKHTCEEFQCVKLSIWARFKLWIKNLFIIR